MIRLETLERRNLGRGKAIEQASKATWDELSPKEKRKARQYLTRIELPGDSTRRPAREVEFLKSVTDLIEQTTGSCISFSRDPVMRAAIYSRFSSENQSASSLADQIEVCTPPPGKGWPVRKHAP